MVYRMKYQAALVFFAVFSQTAYASFAHNLPPPVSPIGRDIYDLHMTAFYICCVIALVVFSIVIYSILRFRKSRGAKAAHFHDNLTIEIIWTLIPLLILAGLAVPAIKVLANIHDTKQSALTIKITGYQWKWHYEYVNKGVKFYSFLSTPPEQIYGKAPKNKWFLLEVDNPLVVPVNTKVKLLITSDDVVHSWWVPALGVKQDAIPGFINENWFYITKEGEYRGQCGELCGINHAFMPIVVKAVSAADFDQWLKSRQQKMLAAAKAPLSAMSANKLLTEGRAAYANNCAVCHQSTGEGLSKTIPALKGSRVVVAPAEETIAFVLRGVPGTPMQAFGKILDDDTLAAIITYIRNTWGNAQLIKQAGYPLMVQPKEIERVRHLTES